MTRNHGIKQVVVLVMLGLLAGLGACGGCDDNGQGDDGGFDGIDVPDTAGDLDVVSEDVPADDAVAHEDVSSDDVPADPVGDEEPSTITWTVTDLGVSAVSYDIARDNTDRVHMIWKQAGPGSLIQYGRIETGALAQAVEIPGAGDVSTLNKRPRLAVAPDGSTVHTAWVAPGNATLYYIWRNAGGTWQARETVYAMSDNWKAAQAAIGADADGFVHIIAQQWCDEGLGTCPADAFRLVYWRKPISGAWSDWTDIETAGGEWRQCDIAVDRSGGIHAAWKSYANREGHYCHAPSGGTLVGCGPIEIPVPEGATAVSCGSSFSTAEVSGGGDVYHAGWSLGPSYTIDVARKPAGSDTFSVFGRPSLESFPMDTGIDPWPVIGVDDFDRIFVSWVHMNDADDTADVYMSIYEDGAWNREIMDDDSGVDNTSRSVLAVTGRAVYLVWRAAGGNLMLAGAEF